MPLATAEIAESLELHANTVRPHLERMREVGLLDVATEARGGVGRPQHLYSLAADAPSLGLEPPPFPMLARMLLRLAAAAGVSAARTPPTPAGTRVGPTPPGPHRLLPRGARRRAGPSSASTPTVAGTDDGECAVVAFAHCPFRELAEAHPDLVCGLHRGLVEGFVEAVGRRRGRRLPHPGRPDPCQVELVPTESGGSRRSPQSASGGPP